MAAPAGDQLHSGINNQLDDAFLQVDELANSHIVRLSDDTLIAAVDESDADDLFFYYSTDEGQTWTRGISVNAASNTNAYSLAVDSTDRIFTMHHNTTNDGELTCHTFSSGTFTLEDTETTAFSNVVDELLGLVLVELVSGQTHVVVPVLDGTAENVHVIEYVHSTDTFSTATTESMSLNAPFHAAVKGTVANPLSSTTDKLYAVSTSQRSLLTALDSTITESNNIVSLAVGAFLGVVYDPTADAIFAIGVEEGTDRWSVQYISEANFDSTTAWSTIAYQSNGLTNTVTEAASWIWNAQEQKIYLVATDQATSPYDVYYTVYDTDAKSFSTAVQLYNGASTEYVTALGHNAYAATRDPEGGWANILPLIYYESTGGTYQFIMNDTLGSQGASAPITDPALSLTNTFYTDKFVRLLTDPALANTATFYVDVLEQLLTITDPALAGSNTLYTDTIDATRLISDTLLSLSPTLFVDVLAGIANLDPYWFWLFIRQDGRLHIVPKRSFQAWRGADVVSDVFRYNSEVEDYVMSRVAAAWASNSGASTATLKAAINAALGTGGLLDKEGNVLS